MPSSDQATLWTRRDNFSNCLSNSSKVRIPHDWELWWEWLIFEAVFFVPFCRDTLLHTDFGVDEKPKIGPVTKQSESRVHKALFSKPNIVFEGELFCFNWTKSHTKNYCGRFFGDISRQKGKMGKILVCLVHCKRTQILQVQRGTIQTQDLQKTDKLCPDPQISQHYTCSVSHPKWKYLSLSFQWELWEKTRTVSKSVKTKESAFVVQTAKIRLLHGFNCCNVPSAKPK